MEIRKNIEFTAFSATTEGQEIMNFTARINSDDPTQLTYYPGIQNQALYKENRAQAKSDQLAFEDAVYAEQDKLIASKEEEK